MVSLRFDKVVAALPTTLTPNTCYLIRSGDGVEVSISNADGTAAYSVGQLPQSLMLLMDPADPIPTGYELSSSFTVGTTTFNVVRRSTVLQPPVMYLREGTLTSPSLATSLGPFSQRGPRPYVNQFKMAEPWRASNTGGGNTEYAALVSAGTITQEGQINAVPSGLDNITTRLLEFLEPNMGCGPRWTLMWDGEGNAYIQGGQNVVESPGRIEFDFTANGENFINFLVTGVTNGPLRNFRLINELDMADYEAGRVFRPAYVDEVRNYRALRMDNWVNIVENQTTTWASRCTPAYETYRAGFAPLEHCVDICNLVGADLWFCHPYQVTDDYVAQAAALVRDRLDDNRLCYVEYAQKCWDFATPQAHYCREQGDLMFGTGTAQDGENYMEWYGVRSAQVARIWRTAWGATERLHTVFETHTDWEGLESIGLDAPRYVAMDPANEAPSTAFTDYAVHSQIDGGMAYGDAYTTVEEWRTTLTETEVFDRIRDQSLTAAWFAIPGGRYVDNMIVTWGYHKGVADSYGLSMICYDGGSHLHAGGAALGNSAHTSMLSRYHYSSQFAEVAQAMLDGYHGAGGDLFSWSVHSRPPEPTINVGLRRYEGDTNPVLTVVETWNATHAGPAGRGAEDFVGPQDRTDEAEPQPEPVLQQMAVHIDSDIDTSGERDDISAMALWFASQDDFNIVGLTASAPDSRSQEYLNCIAAYEQDRDAMIANGADPALFKPADDFRAMVIQGSRTDARAVGYWLPENWDYAAPHAAAQSLIANALAHGDPTSTDPTRKLWVVIQGGYTTLAQALYEAMDPAGPMECPDILDRIRVVGQPNYNSAWAPNAWNYIFGNVWPAAGTPGMFGDLWMLNGYLQWHAFNRDNGGSDTTFWNEITAASFFGQHLRDTLTRPGGAFTSPHFRAGDAGAWFWMLSAKEQNNFDPANPANLCGVYRTYEGVNPWPSQTVGYGAGSGLGSVDNPEGVTWSTTMFAPELTVDSFADAEAAVDLTEWYSRVADYMARYKQVTVPDQVTDISYGNGTLSWVAPHDGFSPITDYIVTIDGAVFADGTGTAPSADVSSLADGTYTATVAAVNAIGTGPVSNTYQFTVDSAAPTGFAFALNEGAGNTLTGESGTVATAYNTTWETAPTRLDFNGGSSRVEVPIADALSASQNFVLGVVARLDSLTTDKALMTRNGLDATTQRQFQFRVKSGNLQFVAHQNPSAANTLIGSAITIQTGAWALFTALVEGDQYTLRVNGQVAGTGTLPNLNRTSAMLGVPVLVGARLNPNDDTYTDFLDGDLAAFAAEFGSNDLAGMEASLRAIATAKGITLP